MRVALGLLLWKSLYLLQVLIRYGAGDASEQLVRCFNFGTRLMNNPSAAGIGDPFGDPAIATGHAGQVPGVGGVGGYQSGYAPSVYGSYGRYGTQFGGGYAGYGSGGALHSPYGTSYAGGISRTGAFYGGAQQAQAGGAAVLSGMQEAMQRFARVSALLEEVLRNLHLLFDGVFGLGYSVGAFHDETQLWLSVKTGPVAFLKRIYLKLARLWRLITLFLCSPFAGEFGPMGLVLRLLGLAPNEQALMTDVGDEIFSSSRAPPETAHARQRLGGFDDSTGTPVRSHRTDPNL